MPTPRRMLLRGCARRCPICGQGHLFRRYFRMIERCPRCGLRFERLEGHWTGDLGLNVIVSFTTLFLTLVAGLVLTYPEIPGVALLVVAVTVAVVVPILFFPFARSIWLAIDLWMRPLEPGEVDEPYASQE